MTLFRIAITFALAVVTGAASAQQASRQTYIVQLADSPAASYAGTVGGYPATKPAPGSKLDINASTVRAYIGYLEAQRNNVLSTIPGADIVHKYSVAFNGFAAKLTAAQAKKLQATAGVVSITPDEPRSLDTSRTPAFLGLTGPGGLHTNNVKGENVIIGMVDGGITPENPSFSDKVDANGKPIPSHLAGTLVYDPITNFRPWNGACQTGPGFPASACNNKLIGARAYHAGFDAAGLVRQPVEFDSPRDADGHGTHTTSTSGGNSGVTAVLSGQPAGITSGIAPRARVAAYKVCWLYVGSDLATCFPSDSMAAIDDAVADGVDVINFSISGTRTNYLDGGGSGVLLRRGRRRVRGRLGRQQRPGQHRGAHEPLAHDGRGVDARSLHGRGRDARQRLGVQRSVVSDHRPAGDTHDPVRECGFGASREPERR